MPSHVVVVESPAKAKTINKYLGGDYTVLASYGHVRDLPSKDGSVRPDEDFAMTYEVDEGSKKQLKAIGDATKGADTLFLATDPDREGEAISWHVLEALKDAKKLGKDTQVHRIAFHEITKKAVTHAVANPRDIDMDLVNAQQARRALDYLVGFTLSPVLWRKLPGSRSAGRVQSVALRLICEREQEIELFKPQEYWDISLDMATEAGDQFTGRLTYFEGDKLEKFTITNEAQAKKISAALEAKQFSVSEVTPKQQKRNPYAPFQTSTLQMDASRKLGFTAKRTMQVAQKLYEGIDIGGETTGLITYMRTDGITVSGEAVAEARGHIESNYGKNYVPDSPRMFKTKAKNAQEAHEAIRPTALSRTPQSLKNVLDDDQYKLYDLIWKRMVASQMEAAVYDQVAIDMQPSDKSATVRVNGSVLKFDGFLKLYQVGRDDDEEDEQDTRLPEMSVGQNIATREIKPEQHFTQPPPRFTEASLVKGLEELGIGRPSTYASIISVLIDRNYVKLDKKRFIPESLGRLVTAFLVKYFERYVAYDFTADLEDRLDLIADGEREWKAELRLFWDAFHERIEESKKLTITEVLDEIDAALEPFIFGTDAEEVAKARVCPKCNEGRLGLKTGKFGAFLGCSNYPECNFTRQLDGSGDGAVEGEDAAVADFPKELGAHPDGEIIWLKKGPYGVYVQLGEEKKPKRASLPKGMKPEEMTLEKAIDLLRLPRDIGAHPETGEMISAGIGRYGPYILHAKKYTSLPAEDDVLTVGINRAVALIADAAQKKGTSALRVLGTHPDDGEEIGVYSGRYGPYVKYKKVNATLPKEVGTDEITLEQALELIAKKAKAPAKKKKAPAKKKPAKKD